MDKSNEQCEQPPKAVPFFFPALLSYAEATAKICEKTPELESVAVVFNWGGAYRKDRGVPRGIMLGRDGKPVACMESLLGLLENTAKLNMLQINSVREALEDSGLVNKQAEEERMYHGTIYAVAKDSDVADEDKLKVPIDDFRVSATSPDQAAAKAIDFYWSKKLETNFNPCVEVHSDTPAKKESSDGEANETEEPSADTAGEL